MLTSNNIQPSSNQHSTPMKRSPQPQQSDPLNCPRCDSTNTKFCYYNNYNKTQPRHYCKACKRHWTHGGTLRNVPDGGARKNKRVKRPNTPSTATSTAMDDPSLGFNDQKYMFPHDKGLFFKPNDSEFNQVSWDFNGSFTTTITMQQLAHQNLTSIDTNPNPIIPTSFTPLLSGFKDDPTLTTSRMTLPDSSTVFSQPWILQAPTTSNFMEYWIWNDIDSVVQANYINKPFNDPQMKI